MSQDRPTGESNCEDRSSGGRSYSLLWTCCRRWRHRWDLRWPPAAECTWGLRWKLRWAEVFRVVSWKINRQSEKEFFIKNIFRLDKHSSRRGVLCAHQSRSDLNWECLAGKYFCVYILFQYENVFLISKPSSLSLFSHFLYPQTTVSRTLECLCHSRKLLWRGIHKIEILIRAGAVNVRKVLIIWGFCGRVTEKLEKAESFFFMAYSPRLDEWSWLNQHYEHGDTKPIIVNL